MHFTELINLASERLGAKVLEANNEFFAPKENLIKPGKPIHIEGKYTDCGKWRDGWETRRRRAPGHDWCVMQLGLPGIVRGAVVDTAFFIGNFPEQCSIDGAARGASNGSEWVEILPKSYVRGDSLNEFAIDQAERRFTHVRLNIYPDGGVARLRIHGEAVPDWTKLGREVDLAAVENGGRAIACSGCFVGTALNLSLPGRPLNIGDGWETKRRRGPGHDWAILRLGAPGVVRKVEIDTSHFFGNYPDTASLEGSLTGGEPWTMLIPQAKLQAHTQHLFKVPEREPVSHVRLNIFPDGGVARLRVWGVWK
ncbi:MAG: allantoicase [Bryobacteraceae bacterium]